MWLYVESIREALMITGVRNCSGYTRCGTEDCSIISHISRLASAQTILGPLELVASYTQSIDEVRTGLKRFWFDGQIAGPPKSHVTCLRSV